MGLVFAPLGLFSFAVIVGGALWLIGTLPELRVRGVFSIFEVGFATFTSMFSLDRWGEVFDTIRRNKLRTALTAISVAWGIFVMIVLLGMGRGLNNGIRYSFRQEAMNVVRVTANRTSIPYAGYNVGRKLTFQNRDYTNALTVKGIDHLDAQFFIKGGAFGGGEMKLQRGVKSNVFGVNAVYPDNFYTGGYEIIEGRYLNAIDIGTLRKAVVIGKPVRDFLFGHGDSNGPGDGGFDDPIGQWIVIGGVPFEVIGVYTDQGSEEEERQVFLPTTTAQLAFNGADRIGMLSFTVGDANAATAHAITREIVGQLAASHQFSPDDPQAARVFDNVEGYERFSQFFLVISLFVLVIGLGTLAAGVVGVSNIMMIAVRERTREIGIRKALGATPVSIVAMIVQEAVFLTSIAGLIGLSAAVGFLSVMPHFIQTDMIRDPSVRIGVGVLAALGLVVAGALAGFVPARAAAKVNPVQTLRDA
ncbi:MAG TPA: ABC transporter permease [Kofleriaceae bacterium]|jgi:putative ABC transport system permease protein